MAADNGDKSVCEACHNPTDKLYHISYGQGSHLFCYLCVIKCLVVELETNQDTMDKESVHKLTKTVQDFLNDEQ